MNQTNDEFEFLDQRLKEFDNISSNTKSETLASLVSKARNLTENSLDKLLTVQKSTYDYLNNYRQNDQNKITEYGEHMNLLSEKLEEFKTLQLSDDFRQTLTNFYLSHIQYLKCKLELESKTSGLVSEVFQRCTDEFYSCLLLYIFKPETDSFYYEAVIDSLNYLLTKLIPLLEELKVIAGFSASVQKKRFAQKGDKILMYLEQYIDAIASWNDVADSYLRIFEK